MILNDSELKFTEESLSKLKEALGFLNNDSSWLAEVQKDSIHSQILELEEEIRSYQRLKGGLLDELSTLNVNALANYLISARIAKGISQEQLAKYLNIPEVRFKALESSNYSGVSLSRALKVAEYIGLDIQKIVDDCGDTIFESDEGTDFQWDTLPIKEMLKRGWISAGSNIVEEAKSFIQGAFGYGLQPALHRKTSYAGKPAHKTSLIAWQAKVLSSAEHLIKSKEIPTFELNDSWLPELVTLSKEDSGPLIARSFLESKGIILVFEPHLEGTFLDGAAMLSEEGNPIVGMTLRYDRVDNFWFVLMHELGHVFLHLSKFGHEFVDENVGEIVDGLEGQADKFALDNLIPPNTWKTAVSRVIPTNAAIIGDAKRIGVHPAIIAGRLRREKNDYTKFNDLVGYGKVRGLFE
ncbi:MULTISPECIES: XRE family transcriptional regulator [Vibrio]|uniref:XRE family transcriptional regulator n=1 Tax=Vibrio TaxID=662 RepID=UPI001882948F|nr:MULTISPECIES: XRE family transcriptional regulator [Vibrio]EJM7152610.1 helix-turn-helix domain-containing protein [Vibrio parahaemolyticus]MBE8568384.1 helix-turn-helix domain-containing protein [Vibrio sp. OPT46]MBE8580580.1 helix-turn-helix domain-containing protein [Vibrio sp. OPT41]MCQ9061323.1 helix-turn-helix domain-containing protein [Vibrio alginolyticus]